MPVCESAKEVAAALKRGAELWYLATSMLPGRWELRERGEANIQVHWDAIDTLRTAKQYARLLDELESHEEGRHSWMYRLPQMTMRLTNGRQELRRARA